MQAVRRECKQHAGTDQKAHQRDGDRHRALCTATGLIGTSYHVYYPPAAGVLTPTVELSPIRSITLRQTSSEACCQQRTNLSRLDRMEMEVINRLGFIRHLRGIEIGDVVRFLIESIQQRQGTRQRTGPVVADVDVDQRGRLGSDAVVFDQGAGAEVA